MSNESLKSLKFTANVFILGGESFNQANLPNKIFHFSVSFQHITFKLAEKMFFTTDFCITFAGSFYFEFMLFYSSEANHK